jgi:phospholipid-binding lipoprotein MlaA
MHPFLLPAALLFASLLLTGCAAAHNPNDPLEPLNRGVYRFNDALDKAVLKPAAKGYSAVMPTTGKIMVSNFFSNLDDIMVTVNDLLQFKLVQGYSDGMRFLVNSTIGVFGLIDVASTGGLKKHDEDLGQTLGTWGVGNGPYLVLPIIGPSTVRDGVGFYADLYLDPMYYINDMSTRNLAYLAQKITRRAELLDQEKVMEEAQIDRYAFIRDIYLLHRKSLMYDGNPPRQRYDDEENDDTAVPKTSPATNMPSSSPAENQATPLPQ